MPSYSIVDKSNVSLVDSNTVTVTLSVYPKNSTFTTYTVTSANTNVAVVTSLGTPSSMTTVGLTGGFIETGATNNSTGSPITFTVQKGTSSFGTTTISITNGDSYAPTTFISVISVVPVDPATVALQDAANNTTVTTVALNTPTASSVDTIDLNLSFNTATNQVVYWGSSNPLVATVNDVGLVTAVSNGTATIRAYTQDGGSSSNTIVKSCSVTVGQTPYNKVEKLNFTCPNSPTGLAYTLYPAGGAPTPAQNANAQVGTPIPVTATFARAVSTDPPLTPTYTTVYFSSSDQNVAKVQLNSVTSLPEVIPVGYGKATITAFSADGGKTATLAFEFKPLNKAVPAVLAFSATVPAGQTLPTLSMESGSTAKVPLTAPSLASSAFFYCYDSSGKVTVDSTGLITANAPGESFIFVYSADGTRSATLRVDVTTPLVALLIDQTPPILLQTGSSYPLTVTRIPSTATGGTIAWSSSTPAYVAVSTTGVVSALATGPSNITATSGQIISSSILVKSLGKVILFDPYDISPQGYMSVVNGVNTLTMVEGVKYNITTITDSTCGPVAWNEVNDTGGNISSGLEKLDIVPAGNLAVVSVKTGQTGLTKLKAASGNAIYFGSAFDTLNINMVAASAPTGLAIDFAKITSDDAGISVPANATDALTLNIGPIIAPSTVPSTTYVYYIPVSFTNQPTNYSVTWSVDIPGKINVIPNNGVYPSCNISRVAGASGSCILTVTASDASVSSLNVTLA